MSPHQWSFGYIQGLIFIFLVALIWAASSVLVQYLYTDFSFDSPFILTFIGSSLFVLWLPTKHLGNWLERNNVSYCSRSTTTTPTGSSSSIPSDTSAAYQNIPSTSQNTDLNGHINNEEEVETITRDTATHPQPWTNEQHIRTAIYIAPVWFMANWTYNASLQSTSITSSTVLASTGSLFTFLFAVLARDENFGWVKLAGVLLGVTGSCLTALSDVSNNNDDDNSHLRLLTLHRMVRGSGAGGDHDHERALLGDFLGLLSAIGYGGYAVQTRLLCPHDESLYSMQLLLGYIGLLSLVTLSPFVLYLLWFEHAQLSWFVLGALVVKGLFDNVLSDYLWLRAVILTNATIATVGLGMTIPMAFVSDVWMGKSGVFNVLSVTGALSVLAGFVLVNVGNRENDTSSSSSSRSYTRAQPHPPSSSGDMEESDRSMEELGSLPTTEQESSDSRHLD